MNVRLIFKGYVQDPNGEFNERYKTVVVEVPKNKLDFSIFKEFIGGEIIWESEDD